MIFLNDSYLSSNYKNFKTINRFEVIWFYSQLISFHEILILIKHKKLKYVFSHFFVHYEKKKNNLGIYRKSEEKNADEKFEIYECIPIRK